MCVSQALWDAGADPALVRMLRQAPNPSQGPITGSWARASAQDHGSWTSTPAQSPAQGFPGSWSDWPALLALTLWCPVWASAAYSPREEALCNCMDFLAVIAPSLALAVDEALRQASAEGVRV